MVAQAGRLHVVSGAARRGHAVRFYIVRRAHAMPPSNAALGPSEGRLPTVKGGYPFRIYPSL